MEVSESSVTIIINSNAADVVQSHMEIVKCESCGFTEECTLPYISQIREHYIGRWICGLCVESVKCEIMRSDNRITTEEALDRPIDFYNNFMRRRLGSPILAMGRIMRRRLGSPRGHRSAPTTPIRNGGKISHPETLLFGRRSC